MQDLELCQYQPDSKKGHYESYFLRANHPAKAQAFWIRYTIFSPKGQADKAIGEIWAMYFDGEPSKNGGLDRVVAVQEDISMAQCKFPTNEFSFKVGENLLEKGKLSGSAALNQHKLSWNLRYDGKDDPVLLFPEKMYKRKLPKAKVLVTIPNAIFNGTIIVDGEEVSISDWQGSENHNWGSKHTDQYAWGQVAGFDNHPNAFLECSTARIKLGPVWSPWMTLAVLVIDGKRYSFNTVGQAIKAKAKYDYFSWSFSTKNKHGKLTVTITAPSKHFAGLSYKNPPKGSHTCLNSKIAHCQAILTDNNGKETVLKTHNRAAFEILTDETNHNVSIQNKKSQKGMVT